MQEKKVTTLVTKMRLNVTLSVKTQLKSFFSDLLFSTKNNPAYGKEHSVKNVPLYL